MNCDDVLITLETTHPSSPERDEVAEHLSQCPHCQHFAARSEQFDFALGNALQDIPIPAGLKDRLLTACHEPSGASDRQTNTACLESLDARDRQNPPSCLESLDARDRQNNTACLEPSGPSDQEISSDELRTTSRAADSPATVQGIRWSQLWKPLVGMAAVVFVGLSIIYLNQDREQQFQLATLQAPLSEFRDAVENGRAATFDEQSFSLARVDRNLLRLKEGELYGVDLGQGSEQDAIGFRFTHRAATGVIIALPALKLSDAPERTFPQVRSTDRQLQWTSEDGSLTYVCYLSSGSAEAFVKAYWGTMA